jgi:DNA polymerase III subunit gamma/tau
VWRGVGVRPKFMSHTTFYRKYRSETFDQLIGQDHIKQTLINAIKFDRLSHAYIFSGPRGTGKTSVARILAKALNCQKGKSETPCLACPLCQKIARSNAVDVIEIDAASNTGVDNIRELNDRVNYMPVECRYKVYIIDEAHMLSAGAFNALLKTMEEPPANTVFILATTEPQKIPATIHSRCQRLNFRRLTLQELIQNLKQIAAKEQIKISDKGLQIIAKNALGCMRDAVSLLDQLYSFSGPEISDQDIILMLGTLNFDALYELIESILNKDTKKAIQRLSAFIDEGINISQLVTDLKEFFKNLIFLKMGLADLLSLDAEKVKQLSGLCTPVSLAELQNYLATFAKLDQELRWAPSPELLLQIRILGLISTHSDKAAPKNIVSPLESKPVASPIAIPKKEVKEQVIEPKKEVQINEPVKNNVEKWAQVLAELHKKSRVRLYPLLSDSHFIEIKQNIIFVGLGQNAKFNFHKEKLKEETSQQILGPIFQQVYGQALRLDFTENSKRIELSAPESGNGRDAISGASVSTNTPESSQSKKINQIIEIFEGELV